jgi:transglutaminase-like putative cysteine protease
MYYSIRHLTKFLYSNPVSESMMETRMHPRSDQNQLCLTFHLSVSPRCRVFSYRDHLANQIHHFDIPGQHGQLVIVAESLVDVQPAPQVPAFLAPDAWADLDAMVEQGDYWEMLLPSEFATCGPSLDEIARTLDVCRRDDPLMVLHRLNQQIYEYFDYKPKSTKVDSPIDLALSTRAGVCQDFAHIMIALVRSKLQIPCRYVSGYLFHGESDMDRSVSSATHAWVEALLPQLGWVGFDPTNWLVAGDRHIRTAIGRDYADVPPTHGIFRGRAKSELTVAVRVTPSQGTPVLDQELPVPEDWSILVEKATQLPEQAPPPTRQQQMAQQQQENC